MVLNCAGGAAAISRQCVSIIALGLHNDPVPAYLQALVGEVNLKALALRAVVAKKVGVIEVVGVDACQTLGS